MKRYNFFKKGFTFIEAIAAVAIFIFISVAMVTIYVNYVKAFNYNQAVMKLAGSARSVSSEVEKMVLQSNQIIDSHIFSGNVYTTNSDTLVLELPSIDNSKNIVNGKYDYIVFYIEGSGFYELIQADADSSRVSIERQIAESVKNIVFTYDNSNVVEAKRVDLTLDMQETVNNKMAQYRLDQEIYLRNK
ncbi:MAG: type II secretion system protein [Candidatus Moranbacteria bacterium]|nr:type II secretion system protein [Candidatus Moranbacteria bacterium]